MWQILAEGAAESASREGLPTPVILVFAAGIIGLLMLYSTRRRIKRNQKNVNLSAKEQVARGMQGREVYAQINELMGELADLSRQINGQLDTRLAKLQVILREADQAIARLEERAGKQPANDTVAKVSPAAEPHNYLPENHEVLERASRGMSAVAIAQELSRPVGEIELILALARRKGSQDEK
jgi:hypothetical protein